MKNLTKKDLLDRFENCNYKSRIKDLKLKKPMVIRNMKFDKMLCITIPGEPIRDGRPRGVGNLTEGTGHFYNPEKAQLMKVMREVIRRSGTDCDKIVISSPLYINLIAYECMTKVSSKYLKDKEDLLKENMVGIFEKDVDNIEKVHYDVLQDAKIMFIINDAYIIKNCTEKVFVDDPRNQRVEINIYYTDKELPYYTNNIIRGKEWLPYILSPKYKANYNIPDEMWSKVFYTNLINYIKENKTKKITKTVRYILENIYTIDKLQLIESGTRIQIIDKICNNTDLILERVRKQKKRKK